MEHERMMTAGQVRAARALLEWSQRDLVEKSGLSLTTIRRMEDSAIGPGRSSAENVSAVEATLTRAGVVFIPANGGGPGVRLAEGKRNDPN